MDPRIHVAIKSYKRAGRVTTLAVAPFASVWVPESQGDAYRKHYGARVITIPDECDGSVVAIVCASTGVAITPIANAAIRLPDSVGRPPQVTTKSVRTSLLAGTSKRIDV